MAWDEWEQIKADAAANGPTTMQLNQAPSEGGPPGGGTAGDLKSDRKTWVRVGEGVTDLKGGIGKALTKLADGQAGLGDTTGSVSAAAQKELYDSWKKYVSDVRGRCEALGGLLQKTGHDLSKSDEEALADLKKLQVRYEDTEPVGGQPKEK
ncbi:MULTISPECIES: hypothetical protein [unclassified Streptomyces]|uniref:hypothetical protein n=1 Tax=unclassified Streptomyces TaxID=2593676 RepID=UPI000932C1A8|nr:hypothetical protein [Streptomyces sp. NBRC 110465]